MDGSRGIAYRLVWPVVVGGLLLGHAGRAVIFEITDDPGYNTNAPAGALAGSGWQYQGRWNTGASGYNYLGTVIAPRFFIAAKHVGGSTGQVFTLNGVGYRAVAYRDCPGADLRVWEVAGTFPAYARLFTGSNEVGKHCVVFGRGTRRGVPVVVDGATNGWRWGANDGVLRWGENDVAEIVPITGYGDTLYATFDRGAGSNECHLSIGDSSGAMFVEDGGEWKLAGIHLAVDGYFSTTGSSTNQFDAALLDMGGLYIGSGSSWTFITNQVADIPSGFYSTRISANAAWIQSVIDFLPGSDLRITGIEQAASDMLISLSTASNRLYRVEWAEQPVTNSWSTLTNNVTGTGGIVTVTDPGAVDLPRRFYRVRFAQ
jgi:hypothetical protein